MQVRRGGGGGEPHPHRVADEGYELRPHGGASDDDGWCGPPASYAKLVLPASLPVGLCPFMPASLQPMAKVIRLWSGTRPNAYHCPDMSAGVQPMPALLVKYGRWLVQPEPAGFSQGDLDREFHLHSTNLLLWTALQRPAWSPATHATFPQAFKQAARTLLLAAQAAGLAALPSEVLAGVLGQAAYPLSSWL